MKNGEFVVDFDFDVDVDIDVDAQFSFARWWGALAYISHLGTELAGWEYV